MATQQLTIFLLKHAASQTLTAMRAHAGLTEHAVQSPNGTTAQLFLKAAQPHPPRWVKMFDGSVTPQLGTVFNASASAVLILDASARAFALTFGQGRHLLPPDSYDERFGLKAALNSIDRTSVRSIDKRSFDAAATHTRSQAGQSTSLDYFGIDVEQDLLRAVVGSPALIHASLGRRVSGMDALQVVADCTLDGLPNLVGYALGRSVATDYLVDFPWIDNIAEVRSKARIAQLNAELLQLLPNHLNHRIWLAVPEVIEWSRVVGFQYKGGRARREHVDLHLTDFLNHVGNPATLTLDLLTKRRVVAVDGAGTEQYSWPVHRCISAEIDVGGFKGVLSDGKWYSVAPTFVATVDTYFAGLPRSTIPLPDFTHTSEGAYIADAVARTAGLYNLDQHLIAHGGGHSSIELCDILSDARDLVHVKRYGSSSVFSHHFAQAMVSSELLADDGQFRTSAQTLVPPAVIPFMAEPFEPRNFNVVLAVISRHRTTLDLPFFSKVNLRSVARRLKGRGFNVQLLHVFDARP